MEKNAVVPVPLDQVGQGFYSTFFVVPKKTGGIPSKSKFKTTKQIRYAQGVQTGFHPHYKSASSARRLYNVPIDLKDANTITS